MNPWLGILIVLAVLGLCLGMVRLLEKGLSPHPEVLRKLVHVLMGLVAVSFPWLFDRAWPVLLLAGASLVTLVLIRSGVSAARSLQGVLHGVKRSSWGELLFPISVALVFVLAGGDPLLYCVPILILTLADAVAALIGIVYGRLSYSTLEGSKSIEGSLAFSFVAFLCVHVSVLLFTDVGRAESLLIGLLMAVIVMLFEAVAWRGLDNLFVPVAGFALMKTYLDADVTALLLRLLVILALGGFVLFWRRRSTLDDSALVGAVLVAYGAWALGDLYWLLVPVLVFVLATILARRVHGLDEGQLHSVYALLGIAGPGLAWLVLNHHTGSEDLLFAYAVAFAAHLTMLGVSWAHRDRERLPLMSLLPAVLQGWLVVLAPLMLLWGLGRQLAGPALIGGLAMLLAALAFWRLQPGLAHCPVTGLRWARQAMIAGAVSILAWFAVQWRGGGGLWT